MKGLVLIFSLLISSSIFAQNRDTFYVAGKKMIFKAAAAIENRSLIIIDGKKYKGSFESIDPNAIASVDVLKPKDAVALFGDEGKNGVFLFKMTDKFRIDASNERLRELINYISSRKPNLPLIIVNYIVYKGDLNSFNAADIQNVDILDAEYASSRYGAKAKAGAVLISTTQKIDTLKGTFKNYKQ